MSDVTKASDASMDTITGMVAPHVAGDLFAGEALAACDLCYIKASDGKVYRSDGTAANEKAVAPRLTPVAVAIGRPVALFGLGTRYRLAASGLTPGALYYLSAVTPGGLGTAASTGDAVGTVQAVSATDVVIVRSL